MDSAVSLKSSNRPPRLVLMWRGNILAPDQPTTHVERLKPLAAAMSEAGIDVSSLVYFDDQAEQARARLQDADGVMVWVNPVQDGQDRCLLDRMLRQIASEGVWVSTHPDTTARMGVKDVLFTTQELGWGCDTARYPHAGALRAGLPEKLAAGPRVLKPWRGNDGAGVIKAMLAAGNSARVRIQAASDNTEDEIPLDEFLLRLEGYFADGGHVIDQAFNDNAAAGMVRCYMSLDRVVGFSEQAPRAPLSGSGSLFGMNSAKTMHARDAMQFATLRASMEQDWTPGLQRLLNLSRDELPALWDADFLHRPLSHKAASPFVLCEINVSSVSPFPDAAAPLVAGTVANMLRARR